MKQNIDYNEFYDLSEEMQEKLLLSIGRLDLTLIDFGNNHKLFTIGKMIEVLHKLNKYPIVQEIQGKNFWNVLADYNNGEFKFDIDAEELCDALWQAVKEVL